MAMAAYVLGWEEGFWERTSLEILHGVVSFWGRVCCWGRSIRVLEKGLKRKGLDFGSKKASHPWEEPMHGKFWRYSKRLG